MREGTAPLAVDVSHPFVAEWRDIPPRPGPWMDVDPPTPPMCETCRADHDKATDRLRRLLHQLTDYNDRLRRDHERLEAEHANLAAANAALRRHHGVTE